MVSPFKVLNAMLGFEELRIDIFDLLLVFVQLRLESIDFLSKPYLIRLVVSLSQLLFIIFNQRLFLLQFKVCTLLLLMKSRKKVIFKNLDFLLSLARLFI